MINAEQIRAARALLDWSTAELAAQTGLTVNGINKIERGHVQPHSHTLEDVQRVFEAAGVEFIGSIGVQWAQHHVRTLTGVEGLKAFFDDVRSVVQQSNREIVICGVAEDYLEKKLGNYLDYHRKQMAGYSKLKMRCIVEEQDFSLGASDYCHYRWLSRDYFSNVPFYIYGDKMAIIVASGPEDPLVLLINNRTIAEAYRRQFGAMWTLARETQPQQKRGRLVIRPKPHPRDTDFTLAMERWLSGDMSGHLGPYMYTDDRDDHRWKDGHSAEAYYLGRDDKATFDTVVRELDVSVENFFDLGPGGEASVIAKSLPMLHRIKAKHYLPVDLSSLMARAAAQMAGPATPLIADFFEPMAESRSKSLIALMGGTLGNLETHHEASSLKIRLIRIFRNYQKLTARNGFFLVSFDANTNGPEIVACYANEAFGRLVRSCVDRAIDTAGFEYHVRWTPGNYQLATGLRARYDQMVPFTGAHFPIEEGEFLPVLNSYRFPVPFVIAAAAEAGWTHQKTWSATGRVHYLLFRTGIKSKATWSLKNKSQTAARTAKLAHARRAGKNAAP